jgi:hypothetical protein
MADITKIVADLIAIIGMTMTQPAGAAPLARRSSSSLNPKNCRRARVARSATCWRGLALTA